MIDNLLTNIAPHYCCGCGQIGTLLCLDCKYNIVSEPFLACVLCGGMQLRSGLCRNCQNFCERAWCVGERHDALQNLIDGLKFERVKAAHATLGELIATRLPDLPDNVVIVPIPTIAPHIRERGYDHTKLIAQHVAKSTNRPVDTCLRRKTNSRQRGATKKQREMQARQAFQVSKPLSSDNCYLLIDDVVTTGSTLRYAAQALKAAGATTVWTAVAARQPLD